MGALNASISSVVKASNKQEILESSCSSIFLPNIPVEAPAVCLANGSTFPGAGALGVVLVIVVGWPNNEDVVAVVVAGWPPNGV